MTIQYILEIIGTLSFTISGALAARHRDHDFVGVWFMGFVTAIGGGSLRDMILGSYPLVWVSDITIIYTIIVGIILTILFYRQLLQLRKTLLLFDTFGIALFTLVGTEKALHFGVRPEIAAIMGIFTAVMGGVIRDTLTNETPVIFQKVIYVSACLAGAIAYLVMEYFDVDRTFNFIVSAILIIGIRLVAVKYNLKLPT